ncbi:NAD(P)-dependent oxidoreductase [Candidatus Amesbacteria bacterium]|nr:NAD(P)-dependent oxidoreductase [Candidatus Amesbacteria bacterium]
MKDELDSKIVITGGSGFIGSYMVKCLKRHGYTNITIVDIVPPRSDGDIFVKADFDDNRIMGGVLNGARYVFHFAAMVGVDKCRLHPEDVYGINDINTKKFIDHCASKGVKRFIFSSSSEIYGNSKDIPYREDGNSEPFSDYAKCKIEIEKYLKNVQSTCKMTVGIVRFFNIYGCGQKKDFVASIFVDKALKNLPLTILGDGLQTRCFTFVDDAVEGVYGVFKYSGSSYEIFNIGNSAEYSINQLAEMVLKIVPQSKSEIVHQNYGNEIRNGNLEIFRRVPAVEKAYAMLAFKATTTLEQGLRSMVDYLTLNEKPQ